MKKLSPKNLTKLKSPKELKEMENGVFYIRTLFPKATISFLVKLRHHATYAIKAIDRLGVKSLEEIDIVNEQ